MRIFKVSYVEKEDDDIININCCRILNKKKVVKEKSIEDKVEGMKEEVFQDGIEDFQDMGVVVVVDVSGSCLGCKVFK